ncbi:MarR family winged helix-turn-helix transcriptional regulator [Salinicoccus sp. CNSTN-B1]
MAKKSDVIHNLKLIYGYGYTKVFNDVTDSITRMHISKTQMDIMQFIYLNGHATPSDLALELNVQRSAITHTVKKLIQKNLVRSESNKMTNDKRSKLIYMTKESEQLVEEFLDKIYHKITTDIGILTKEEEEQLYHATMTILKYIPGGTPDETHT